jgi:hypothetical protein
VAGGFSRSSARHTTRTQALQRETIYMSGYLTFHAHKVKVPIEVDLQSTMDHD